MGDMSKTNKVVKEFHIFNLANPVKCPLCSRVAVVVLPDTLKVKQTDGTTHVCHPALKGCNHGFAT